MYVHVVITIVLIAFRPIYFLYLLVLSLRLGHLVTTAEAVDTPALCHEFAISGHSFIFKRSII